VPISHDRGLASAHNRLIRDSILAIYVRECVDFSNPNPKISRDSDPCTLCKIAKTKHVKLF